jgi:outer membrane protein
LHFTTFPDHRMHRIAATIIALALLSAPAAAQRLTLGDALARADRDGYANRMADGAATTAAAGPTAALRGVLPTLRLEGGVVGTTDPIGAFGTTLRQRRIGPADFDPARLNRPNAARNYAGALVLEQPLFNADALVGRTAARHAADAAVAAAEWTRGDTRVMVVRAYYGAILAREQVATLEAALRAAREQVRRAESLVANGMATRSDALMAAVQAGEVEAQLVEARGRATTATRQLATVMGAPGAAEMVLPQQLPAVAAITALPVGTAATPEQRADLSAARQQVAAAEADLRRARSLYMPRLNAMARYDWNSPERPFQGDENWSVGVMLNWTPFAGASEIAERRAAQGRAQSARAGADAARAQAELEVAEVETEWAVALERLRITATAMEQSREAHRIVSRRYEGGMAPVVELLAAAATETQSALGHSHARYTAIVAAARRLRASGLDAAALTILDRTDDR